MTQPQSTPTTLLGLLTAPDDRTAVIVPEQNIRITYGGLRRQVQAVAEALAAAGVNRGDRVGMALPNGLPTIVAFLAASMAGTAAPLNPGYKEDEFRFYLEDTNAKCCCCRPTAPTRRGARPGRRADPDRRHGRHRHRDPVGPFGRGPRDTARARRDGAHPAHQRQHRPAEARAAQHANLSISARNVARSYALTADDVSLCVMPLFHVHGLVASTLATLATGGTVVVPAQVQPAVVLADRARSRRDLVFGGADDPPAAAGARRSRARRGRRAPRSCASSARAARRCRRR